MKTNILSILVSFFVFTNAFSQTNLNEYKYVVVPKQFSFLKSENQYRINELTQFLFKKYGFTAFMEGDEYPSDFFNNRCATLSADIISDTGMFKTKLTTILKDCNDKVVFTSEIGESRKKEYKSAYNEAVRNTFKSVEKLNYKYTPKKEQRVTSKQPKEVIKNEASTKEIEKLKEEIQTLKQQQENKVAKKAKLIDPVKKEVIQVKEVVYSKPITDVLYAQQTETGYQLVDSSPKVVFKIKSTGLNNVYLIDGKNAIIYKKADNWFIEYYEGNTLKQEVLNIKF